MELPTAPRTFIEDHRGWLTLFGARSLFAALLAAGVLAASCLALGLRGDGGTVPSVGLILVGVSYWTFAEYALHRWVYHFRPRNQRLRRLVESFHVYHHRTPADRAVWNAGPALVLALTVLLALPPFLVLRDVARTALLMAGTVVGYALYEIAHYECHARVHRRGPLAWLQAFHLHHHQRDWRRNFGVTNPFWDRVFGTGTRQGRR
jgi:sterol desaturase/sphingolipid hydroxylase (fatty acid hydroxylase superfamily)